MTTLEMVLAAGALAASLLGVWAYQRARSVITHEKAMTFGYATSVLFEASLQDFASVDDRLQWVAFRLAQAHGQIDRSRLFVLIRAASAIWFLRKTSDGGDQPPLAELGGENLRYTATYGANRNSSVAAKAFAAQAIEEAQHRDLRELIGLGALGAGDTSTSDLAMAQFAVEAEITSLYAAAVRQNAEPLRSFHG